MVGEEDDDEHIRGVRSCGQHASKNLATPQTHHIDRMPDLKSPETQEGLFQKLSQIKEQQSNDFLE